MCYILQQSVVTISSIVLQNIVLYHFYMHHAKCDMLPRSGIFHEVLYYEM